MCGIAGFVGEGTRADVENMIGAIRHRGPDDTGIEIKEDVGLAHARLSIIDLSPDGHQPMWNARGTVVVVFNGEIYNFHELVHGTAGYPYRSRSDTEVILAMYEKEGEKCFEKLDGMFAIALYDFEKKKLLLARDRMGKKPLYYGVFGKTLIFGSELKALLAHPAFRKELDRDAVAEYLLHDCILTPRSIWKGARKLEPGSYLVSEHGAMRKHEFWKLPNCSLPVTDYSLRDATAELDARLDAAVAKRLISDVPLGVFLSGGIDSSTVAYYACLAARRARKNSAQNIKTFSIGFREASYDESGWARRVAAHLGTDHHEEILSAKDALDLVPSLPDVLDEPMADASILPTLLLSKFTRGQVTVALGGDGGDELFLGYPTFTAEKLLPFLRWLPNWIPTLLPPSSNYMGARFQLEQFLQGSRERDPVRRHAAWLATFHRYPLPVTRYPSLTEFYLRRYLMDQVLVKVDRASMRYALEVRAPFLDTAVVEFALSLPEEFKKHFFTGKYILKKLMESRLPREIVWRKKQGFAVPVSQWLRGDLKPLLTDLLARSAVADLGLLAQRDIDTLVREHLSGRADHRKKLWNLLVFELWFKKYGI